MEAVKRHGSWPTFDCVTCQEHIFDTKAGEIARKRQPHDPEPPCHRCEKGSPSYTPIPVAVRAGQYYQKFFGSGEVDLFQLSDRVNPRLFDAIKTFKSEYERRARQLIQQQQQKENG